MSRIFQEAGQVIKADDPRLARIDVSTPGFLARRDRPPVMLLLPWIFPEAVAAPREEIAYSRSSLEEEIDKFHFEKEETPRAQVVHILDAEKETNRHSGVHTTVLVIARPDSTSLPKKRKIRWL